MLRSAGHFARGGKQKGVAPRYALLHDPELPVVELRVAANLGQVAADERQMMLRVDSPQRTNALGSRDVPDAAAERVARIGRICDYAAGASDRGRLPNQATLRVDRMDGEVLGQSKGAACSVAI